MEITERARDLIHLLPELPEETEVVLQQNAALPGPPSEEMLERVQFALIKLAIDGDRRLEVARKLYKSDARDLLVAAGFAADLAAHESWYQSILEQYSA